MPADERYIIDICDEVLGYPAVRQHRFEFLRGDPRRNGSPGTRLPVDAYYPSLNLVVEYREVQHSQATPFFDRKATLSGVSRGEQRRIYDERRRSVLATHGIVLVELDYHLFPLRGRRLKRDRAADEAVVRSKLQAVVENGRNRR